MLVPLSRAAAEAPSGVAAKTVAKAAPQRPAKIPVRAAELPDRIATPDKSPVGDNFPFEPRSLNVPGQG